MRRPKSLRRQLALGISTGIVLLWTAAAISAAYAVREELDETFDSALQGMAERLLPLAVAGGRLADAAEPARVPRAGGHVENLTWVVRNAQGVAVLWSQDAHADTFAGAPELGFRSTGSHRIYAEHDSDGHWTIEVAEPLDNRREAVRESLTGFVLPLLLILPLSLMMIVWRSRAALARLDALSHEVQGRDATDLGPLATAGLQAELLPVRDAVDRLMARLGRALATERSFTANAAHELRTPVAAALAQAQRLQSEAPDSLQPRIGQLEHDLKRLARLSEKLLDLSRAEGAGVLADRPQDLGPFLRFVIEDCSHGPWKGRIRSDLAPLVSDIDPDAFAILARNLVENALIHGEGPVDVALGPGGLRVTNGGAVVPPEVLSRLTTRFERGNSRNEGSGLGLAIAASVVQGAGWDLRLASPAPGRDGGFEARAIPPQPKSA